MGAFAQTGEGGGPPAVYNIGLLVLLVGVFYIVLLRPEQKRRREHEQMVAGLKRNDQVVMSSGIHGRVTTLGDKVVKVEIAPKVEVQVDRARCRPCTRPRLPRRASGSGRSREPISALSNPSLCGRDVGRRRLSTADVRPAGAPLVAVAS